MIGKVLVAAVALLLAPPMLVTMPSESAVGQVRELYVNLRNAQERTGKDPSLVARVRSGLGGSVTVEVVPKREADTSRGDRAAMANFVAKDREEAARFYAALEYAGGAEYLDTHALQQQADVVEAKLASADGSTNLHRTSAFALVVLGCATALWSLIQRKKASTRHGIVAIIGGLLPLGWLVVADVMPNPFIAALAIGCAVLFVSGLRTFTTPTGRAVPPAQAGT